MSGRTRGPLASGGARSIGFLNDLRRMNVALTRARHLLVVIGNAAALSAASPHWDALRCHAVATGALVEIAHSKVDLLKVHP